MRFFYAKACVLKLIHYLYTIIITIKNKIMKNLIKEAYEQGNTYFTGEINGEEFKIRMNKDHARNSGRNDDFSLHNLSLINTYCPSGIGCTSHNGKYQMQVDNVLSWEEAEIQIEEFFYQIFNN